MPHISIIQPAERALRQRCVVRVKKTILSHKNFDTAIDKIIAAAKQIKELISETSLQLQVKKINDNMYFQNDIKDEYLGSGIEQTKIYGNITKLFSLKTATPHKTGLETYCRAHKICGSERVDEKQDFRYRCGRCSQRKT